MQWAHVLGKIYKVPVFILDFPFAYDPTTEHLRENAEYVRSQLERIKEFLLKCSGQKEYKWEKLREQTECCREMAFYQRNISALQQTIPAPASFIDGAVSMTPALTMKNQQAANFYKEYMEEMVDRVKKGIGSLDNEKYRIMWRGNFPWFKVGWISRTLASYGAVLVSGEYGMSLSRRCRERRKAYTARWI